MLSLAARACDAERGVGCALIEIQRLRVLMGTVHGLALVRIGEEGGAREGVAVRCCCGVV